MELTNSVRLVFLWGQVIAVAMICVYAQNMMYYSNNTHGFGTNDRERKQIEDDTDGLVSVASNAAIQGSGHPCV